NVQGRNWASLFLNEKTEMERPAGALYIQNLDGEKDADGKVTTYFPSARGYKTARYTLALYIDKKDRALKKALLFDDEKDPYQMNNLPLGENQEIVAELCREMGRELKAIDDPWYRERILSDMIAY
ncbi:MAG: arylsulfatase, partial [Bacteroides sp.]|nr:arylsulfatase [Bacteroides sp.]